MGTEGIILECGCGIVGQGSDEQQLYQILRLGLRESHALLYGAFVFQVPRILFFLALPVRMQA